MVMEHVPAVLQVRDVLPTLSQRLRLRRGAVGQEQVGRGSRVCGKGGQGGEADDAQRVHGGQGQGQHRGWRACADDGEAWMGCAEVVGVERAMNDAGLL
jgi:hypothetical protein